MKASESKTKTPKPKVRLAPVPGGLLDPTDTAARMKCSEWTLARWRCDGKGPRFIKLGNRVRYSLAAIEEWEKANEAASTSEHDSRSRSQAQ